MDSTGNDNSLLLLVDLVGHAVRDRQVLALVTGDRSAQRVAGDIVQLPRLDLAEVLRELRVSVRLAVGEVDGVLVVLERVRKREGREATLMEVAGPVAALEALSAVVVLEVAEVLAATVPALTCNTILLAEVSILVGKVLLPLRVNKHLHTVIVQRLRLDHVQHVELDLLAATSVGHAEVEPLRVTFRVDIILQYEIVLAVVLLVHELQVARLKARLENECLILGTCRPVVVTAREADRL